MAWLQPPLCLSLRPLYTRWKQWKGKPRSLKWKSEDNLHQKLHGNKQILFVGLFGLNITFIIGNFIHFITNVNLDIWSNKQVWDWVYILLSGIRAQENYWKVLNMKCSKMEISIHWLWRMYLEKTRTSTAWRLPTEPADAPAARTSLSDVRSNAPIKGEVHSISSHSQKEGFNTNG